MKKRQLAGMACTLLVGCNLSFADPAETSSILQSNASETQHWTWKLQPQVGESYELRFFSRVELTRRKPMMQGSFQLRKKSQLRKVDTTWLDAGLAKATFRMDIVESGPRAWKARLTCLDSSFAVIHDGIKTPAPPVGWDTTSKTKRDSIRRALLRESDAHFRRAITGAQVSFACDSNGRFQRWYGAKEWINRIREAVTKASISKNVTWTEKSKGMTGFSTSVDPSFYVHSTLRTLPELQTEIQGWLEGIPSKPVNLGESWSFTAKPLGSTPLPVKVTASTRTLTQLDTQAAEIKENIEFSVSTERPSKPVEGDFIYLNLGATRNAMIRVPALGGFPSRIDQTLKLTGYNTIESGTGGVYQREDQTSVSRNIISCTRLTTES